MNEEEIGEAIRSSIEEGLLILNAATEAIYLISCFPLGVVKREELFIVTKLWNDSHRPFHVRESLEGSLKRLQLDYIDCYMIHWVGRKYCTCNVSIMIVSPRHLLLVIFGVHLTVLFT